MRSITLTLAQTAVYVTGTVNGTAVVFTAAGGYTWTATVERSADDIYRVSVTAIDGSGNSTTVDTTLYYGLHLITDRTEADVQYAAALIAKGWTGMSPAEQTAYLTGLRGAYSAGDYNRVESAVSYILDRLTAAPDSLAAYMAAIGVAPAALYELGYTLPALTVDTGHTYAEDITPAVSARYCGNVSALREVIALPAGTPAAPTTIAGITWQTANDIETILVAVEAALTALIATKTDLADRTAVSWRYCGAAYTGG